MFIVPNKSCIYSLKNQFVVVLCGEIEIKENEIRLVSCIPVSG